VEPTATTVRVASFNMLGYSHTAPGGNRKGWADGLQRTVWATQIMANQNLQVLGLQEFQVPQYKKFVSLVGSTYDVYPGVSMGGVPVQNSLVWRKDLYTAVQTHTMNIPYFNGTPTAMPYVLLRNNATGQELWIYNSHNPADTAGNAQTYRNRAVAKEVRLVTQLEADYPGVPVLDVGDKNDRANYICPIMKGSDLRSASGGALSNGVCQTPYPMYADWVTGNSDVTFSNYHALYTPLVRKTTDHHVLFADATLAVPPPSQHVVVIDVQGLRGPALRSPTSPMPTLRGMIAGGTAATEARTDDATVASVPNILGLLTSRAAGMTRNGYLAGVFDSVHDAGLRTGFWTSNSGVWNAVSTRWSATQGAPDVTGVDNGQAKISAKALATTDQAAMNKLVADLRKNGTAFSFVALSAANKAALRHGGISAQHTAALAAIDGYLQQLLAAVHSSPTLAHSTTIIVTSDHGAVTRENLRPDDPAAYRVPVVAWGAGVGRGQGNLYRLNPQFVNPGRSRVADDAPNQPIRLAYLGNLATRLLGVAGITGSSMDPERTFSTEAGH
jgi:hypothetical protein